jgi:hypothetical protein
MTLFDAVTAFKLMPMKYLSLHDSVSGEDVEFHNLSVDSTYNFEPATKRDGYGSVRTIGYLVTITAVPVGTNLDEMLVALEPFRYNRANGFVRFEHVDGVYAKKGSLWLPAPIGVTWSVAKAEQRGSLRITVTRALDSTHDYLGNPIFFFDQQ